MIDPDAVREDVIAAAIDAQAAHGSPISMASHPEIVGSMTFDELMALPGDRHTVRIRHHADAAGRITESMEVQP